MINNLTISIYRKQDNRAALVFRRNRCLYRISTVKYASAFEAELRGYLNDLKSNRAEPQFLLLMESPRGRVHVLEIDLTGNYALFTVVELQVEGTAVPCFKWCGSGAELMMALLRFDVSAFWSR